MKPKFIFLSIGTSGDLFPFLAMAKEMRRRGYPSLILSAELYREVCEQEGVEFQSIATKSESDVVLLDPRLWKPITGVKLYFEKIVIGTAERMFRALEEESNKGACVLVCAGTMASGLLAYEKLGMPTIRVTLHPFSHFSAVEPPEMFAGSKFILGCVGAVGRRLIVSWAMSFMNATLRPLNGLRHKLGLEPMQDFMGTWHRLVPSIDLWPEWFCPKKADWPEMSTRTGFISYDGPSVPAQKIDAPGLEEFLQQRPVVFTMGSGMLQKFEEQLALFSKSCALSRQKGLMVSGAIRGKGQVIVSDHFRIIEWAPFTELFSLASLIVTHGGIGTVARALASGNPMIVAPLAFDQFDNGWLVKKLQVGECIPFRSMTPRKLAAAILRLKSSPATQESCHRIQEQMRLNDGLKVTCDSLESRFATEPDRLPLRAGCANSLQSLHY